METKIYLGDGAYAEFTGYEVIITAENGIVATNTVVMEPDMVQRLIDFLRKHGVPLK